jgi:hypothetical protein
VDQIPIQQILVTILLIVAWHFPTTFFVPAGPPNEYGWFAWPFGKGTSPAIARTPRLIAPRPGSLHRPSLAMLAAAVASLSFLAAIGALWGIVVPADWWQAATVLGASSSIVLFLLYFGPGALIPLVVDGVVLAGVLVTGWTPATLAAARVVV